MITAAPGFPGLLFLQSAPHRFEELRPVFLEHAFKIVVPDGEAPAPVEGTPFEVDL